MDAICIAAASRLTVGELSAGFILEHHSRKSRKISSRETETILEQVHERNNVYHAFFKEEMFGRMLFATVAAVVVLLLTR